MKIVLLTFLLILSQSSYGAASTQLLFEIEKDLNDYFGETINEGESSAEVARIESKPQIRCGPVIQKENRRLVFCSAEIQTNYESGGETMQGQTICTSLGFVLNKKLQIQGRYDHEKFSQCLEAVYDASYE